MEDVHPVRIRYRTSPSLPLSEYNLSATEEELAGLWIGVLILSDLNLEIAGERLMIIPEHDSEKLWNPRGVLASHLVQFKGAEGSVLSFTLDPKVNTKLMVTAKYVALLTGPLSLAVTQFNKIDFLKGVVVACKLFRKNFREVITRFVDWNTGQKMELI